MHVVISSRWLHECNPHPHINTTALSLMSSLSLSSLGGEGGGGGRGVGGKLSLKDKRA